MNDNERIAAAAKAGDPAAQEQVALSFELNGDLAAALSWLVPAAQAGKPSAVARLGLWELVGRGVPQNAAAGVDKILAGARMGDPYALHIASVVQAGGIGTKRDVGQALVWLSALAAQGDGRAACQLAILARSEQALLRAARMGSHVAQLFVRDQSIEPGVIDWKALAAQADLSPFARPIDRQQDREDPPVWMVPDLIEPWLCDYVIAMAAPTLTRGKVLTESGEEAVRQERSNTVMNFGLANSDVVLELINMRLAAAAGMPDENGEALGVLHYAVGERYAPHVDYIPDTEQNAEQLATRGQRVRTLLVYLNDRFEGGATEFPRLGVGYKPPRGSAIVFDSVKADGSVDPMTLHTGAPPTAGQKWIISKWFRTKALRPPAGE